MTEPDHEPLDAEVAAVVVSVDGDEQVTVGEEQLAATAESGREQLRQTVADLQLELAGMRRTGVPGVDEALDQLAGLDPDDLEGSADLLAEVLRRLESVMSQPE